MKNIETHFVYAGYRYLDDKLKSMILKGMKKYKIRKVMMTIINMSRKNLITEEKMKNYCKGKELEKESINDDLDSFFEDIRLGKQPKDWAGTYFLPKLTEEELKLVETKDSDFMETFYSKMDADVTNAEMKLSESDSKFVHCYGWRETFTIENLKRKISSLFSNNFSINQSK